VTSEADDSDDEEIGSVTSEADDSDGVVVETVSSEADDSDNEEMEAASFEEYDSDDEEMESDDNGGEEVEVVSEEEDSEEEDIGVSMSGSSDDVFPVPSPRASTPRGSPVERLINVAQSAVSSILGSLPRENLSTRFADRREGLRKQRRATTIFDPSV